MTCVEWCQLLLQVLCPLVSLIRLACLASQQPTATLQAHTHLTRLTLSRTSRCHRPHRHTPTQQCLRRQQRHTPASTLVRLSTLVVSRTSLPRQHSRSSRAPRASSLLPARRGPRHRLQLQTSTCLVKRSTQVGTRAPSPQLLLWHRTSIRQERASSTVTTSPALPHSSRSRPPSPPTTLCTPTPHSSLAAPTPLAQPHSMCVTRSLEAICSSLWWASPAIPTRASRLPRGSAKPPLPRVPVPTIHRPTLHSMLPNMLRTCRPRRSAINWVTASLKWRWRTRQRLTHDLHRSLSSLCLCVCVCVCVCERCYEVCLTHCIWVWRTLSVWCLTHCDLVSVCLCVCLLTHEKCDAMRWSVVQGLSGWLVDCTMWQKL